MTTPPSLATPAPISEEALLKLCDEFHAGIDQHGRWYDSRFVGAYNFIRDEILRRRSQGSDSSRLGDASSRKDAQAVDEVELLGLRDALDMAQVAVNVAIGEQHKKAMRMRNTLRNVYARMLAHTAPAPQEEKCKMCDGDGRDYDAVRNPRGYSDCLRCKGTGHKPPAEVLPEAVGDAKADGTWRHALPKITRAISREWCGSIELIELTDDGPMWTDDAVDFAALLQETAIALLRASRPAKPTPVGVLTGEQRDACLIGAEYLRSRGQSARPFPTTMTYERAAATLEAMAKEQA